MNGGPTNNTAHNNLLHRSLPKGSHTRRCVALEAGTDGGQVASPHAEARPTTGSHSW